MSQEITHEKAVEIDTQLAEIQSHLSESFKKLDSAKLSLAYDLGIRPTYVTRNRREVKETLAELQDMAQAKLDHDEKLAGYQRRDMEHTLEIIATYQATIENLKALRAPLEETYRQSPWARFFLVNNANGHIHSSMHCHSCNIRTQYMWLPTLSGLTEKDAVDAHGPRLCTHCYPSAPVEWTVGIQKEADPNECPGSGTSDFNRAPGDRRRYQTCTHCNTSQNVTSTGKLRKHKKETK